GARGSGAGEDGCWGVGMGVRGCVAALFLGSHWLAPDVSLLFFLMAAAVAQPAEAAREASGWRSPRLAAVAGFAGAAVLAGLGTARAPQALPLAPPVGFPPRGVGAGGPLPWAPRPLAVWVRAGEGRRMTLAHFSPTPAPVELTAGPPGRASYRRTLKTGESVSLALSGSPEGPRSVLFEVSRAFVPKRLGLSQDRRELG